MIDSNDPLVVGVESAYAVTERLDGVHPMFPDFYLCPEELILPVGDGTWVKVAPGVQLNGMQLSPEQVDSLVRVHYANRGMAYTILGEAPDLDGYDL